MFNNNKDNFKFSPLSNEVGGKLKSEEILEIANKAAKATGIDASYFELYIKGKEEGRVTSADNKYEDLLNAINATDATFAKLNKLKWDEMPNAIREKLNHQLIERAKTPEEVKELLYQRYALSKNEMDLLIKRVVHNILRLY